LQHIRIKKKRGKKGNSGFLRKEDCGARRRPVENKFRRKAEKGWGQESEHDL